MRKILVNLDTKAIFGWVEAENLDNWTGEGTLYDIDDENLAERINGYYFADDDSLQFDEERIKSSGIPIPLPEEPISSMDESHDEVKVPFKEQADEDPMIESLSVTDSSELVASPLEPMDESVMTEVVSEK